MYKNYLDKELINIILSKIQSSEAILFDKDIKKIDKDLKQFDYFKKNMFEYMLHVALMIFKEKSVYDIAMEVVKEHSTNENYNIVKNNINVFIKKMEYLKKGSENFKLMDKPSMINYMYCELYSVDNKISMLYLKPLIHYLLQGKDHVENIIINEIKNKVDKNKIN